MFTLVGIVVIAVVVVVAYRKFRAKLVEDKGQVTVTTPTNTVEPVVTPTPAVDVSPTPAAEEVKTEQAQ